MRRLSQFRVVFALFAVIVALPASAQTIPTDPQATCTVSSTLFNSWFQMSPPALNGVVNPANGIMFPNTPNCSFYQWGMQMFLWLTSPAPAEYGGGGGRIMDSPTFYDVSPEDSMGNRTLIPHTVNFIRNLNLRAAQPGPHGLPVIFDKTGRMLELVAKPTLAPSGRLLVLSGAAGAAPASVEISRVRAGKNGKALFLDAAGKTILNAKPILPRGLNPELTVQQFLNGKIPIFVNGLGNVVPVEQGQAGGGGVLEAQKTTLPNGSLVYYALMVNDVYAYFLTGSKDNKISPMPTEFPITQPELNQVIAFAGAQTPPKVFPDPTALAVEVKTAWVLASSLPSNGAGYITMTASIPTYNMSSNTTWTPKTNETALLAMVGLHVVGSVNGHPEMIWATFEHVGNTPNAAYSYVATGGTMKSVAQTTAGTWLFSKTGAGAPFNSEHMTFVSPNIVASSGNTISPSNTLRLNAWGANPSVAPNPVDATTAASNSEIISINNSVRGMMPAGDPRDNYFTTGATWTVNGFAPTGSFSGSVSNGIEVGTSQMANSTMETYQQFPSMNCFACHGRGSGTVNPNLSAAMDNNPISHIYQVIKPLF